MIRGFAPYHPQRLSHVFSASVVLPLILIPTARWVGGKNPIARTQA